MSRRSKLLHASTSSRHILFPRSAHLLASTPTKTHFVPSFSAPPRLHAYQGTFCSLARRTSLPPRSPRHILFPRSALLPASTLTKAHFVPSLGAPPRRSFLHVTFCTLIERSSLPIRHFMSPAARSIADPAANIVEIPYINFLITRKSENLYEIPPIYSSLLGNQEKSVRKISHNLFFRVFRHLYVRKFNQNDPTAVDLSILPP